MVLWCCVRNTALAGIFLAGLDLAELHTDKAVWVSIGCSLIASGLGVLPAALFAERVPDDPLTAVRLILSLLFDTCFVSSLPCSLQLGELIKQETAENREAVHTNTHGCFMITGLICLLWIVTIPLYKSFMLHALGCTDTDKLFSLVRTLLGFYVLYAFQNIFDCIFYGGVTSPMGSLIWKRKNKGTRKLN